MIINKINIVSFGKLKNYSIDLHDGINVIYGPNEYGKTTIMNFLKMMFYSKSEKTKLLREKYFPWNGTNMSGSVEIENNNMYYIQKEFGISASKDRVIFQNLSKGEVVSLGKNEEIGEKLFGLDSRSFERSTYITNNGLTDIIIKNSSKNMDPLQDKIISNISYSEQDVILKSNAIKHLNDAQKNLFTERGTSGKINKSEKKIAELKRKINELEYLEKNQLELKDKIKYFQNMKNEFTVINQKLKNYAKFIKTKKIIKLIEQKKLLLSSIANFGINSQNLSGVICKLTEYSKLLDETTIKCDSIKSTLSDLSRCAHEITEDDKEDFCKAIELKKSISRKLEDINKVLDFNNRNIFDTMKTNSNIFDTHDEQISNIINKYDSLKIIIAEKLDKIGLNKNKISELQDEKNSTYESISKLIKKSRSKFNVFLLLSLLMVILSFFFDHFKLNIIFKYIFSILGPLLGLMVIYYQFRIKNFTSNLKSLVDSINLEIDSENRDIEKITDEINKLNSKSQAINDNLYNEVVNYKTILLSEICKINIFINSELGRLNLNNIQEYEEYYYKNQNFKSLKNSYELYTGEKNEILENIKNFIAKNNISISPDNLHHEIELLRNLNENLEKNSNQLAVELENEKIDDLNIDTLEDTLKSINTISDDEFEILKKRSEYLKSLDIDNSIIKLHSSLKSPYENLENIKHQLIKEESNLDNLKKYLKSLVIAKNTMENISDEIKKNFNPKLNSRASEILKNLTDKKYSEIHIHKNYEATLNDENKMSRIYTSFSDGTIDQIYLSLRIAISELISQKANLPFIFDDIFMKYDNFRLKKTLEFLKNYSKERGNQIIIFTCHNTINQFLKEI